MMPVRPLASLDSILSLVLGLTLVLALGACGSGSASTSGAQRGTTTAPSTAPSVVATPAPATTVTAPAVSSPAVATAGSGPPATTPHVMPASPAATLAPPPSPTPIATAAPSVPTVGEVQVQIVNFAFEPASITIKPGTTVVWTNTSPTQHTTTSRQPANAWDSGIMDPGTVFRFTFQQAGEYDYWCALHPEMLGKVIVQP